MATRREVLRGAAALVCGVQIFPDDVFASDPLPRLFSAARIAGKDGGLLWRPSDMTLFPLPGRGHGLVPIAKGDKIIVTGRRPGGYVAIINRASPDMAAQIAPPAVGCRFSGHAAPEPGGNYFATSEFEAGTIRGAIVLRRAEDGSVCNRFDPQGIEPHDMLFAGDRLVVALGGLTQDGGVAGPAFNPDGIDSSVVELEYPTGRIAARHRLSADLSTLSLRHMALAPDGACVVVGMQDQDLSVTRPLMAVVTLGTGITPLPMPNPAQCNFRGYVGSVAVDASGEFAAATSPRGSVIGIWSLSDRAWLAGFPVPDICGLAAGATPGLFWATSGLGEVLKISIASRQASIATRWSTHAGFDNHLLSV
ncbi:MAG TPA: DUF1513 domain-containing protein [Rhizomicrobium sp.]|nr:DUF1513 domain-containing protein [Rhizomicrobium sp.]